VPLMIVFGIAFYKLLCEIAGACTRKMARSKRESLCKDCLHAHVQYATNSRVAISCTYAGTVRPLRIDVLYCTDYVPRCAALARARIIGFVNEIAPAK
jgi:hypothetical protein